MSKSTCYSSLALVTGASRGIGRAAALALAAAGHYVFINYRNEQAQALETLQSIERAGGGGELLQFDVADPSAVESAFDKIAASEHGPLEVLINNAGITADGLLLETALESMTTLLDVNLRGAITCAQQALPHMLPQRYGRIVNVSSIMAQRPNRGVSAYAASKGGLDAFTRALAVEVGQRGITVNAVAPGFVQTDMTADYEFSGSRKKLLFNAVGRPGTPDEIASAIAFLASRKASFINGQVLVADGGSPGLVA